MAKENTFKFPETFNVSCLINSPKQYNIERLIKVIGNKIFGYNIANIIVQYNNKILNKFSTNEYELQALLDKSPIPHTYNLVIRERPQEPMELIICHEMIHFNQYERGDLQLEKDNSNLVYIFKGVKYSQYIDYYSRPWEQEAYQAQDYLWRQFRNYIKTKKALK